jgi:2-oxo-4-hydroxy-4-carboxy-5-ureidoimidazoline decarboxylase
VTVRVDEAGLLSTCGSRRWVASMLERAPFASVGELHAAADAAFDELGEPDWLEAFAHHPRIGDVDALRERFAASGAFSEREQSALGETEEAIIEALHRGNEEYEDKHGFVFLIRAAGRSAHEILAQQRERLGNDRPRELEIAAGQQREITHLRLDARLEPSD